MSVYEGVIGKAYIVDRIETGDEQVDAFLFSLGCYAGEPITLLHKQKGGCIVAVKEGKYSIDRALAKAIGVRQAV